MSQDLPIPRQDDRSDGTSVVEWGTQDEESPTSGRLRRAFTGLGGDQRVPLLLAGLGAVAALASLLGEWVTITLPTGGGDGVTPVEMPSGVSEIGGLGVGYLVGILLLGVVVALALRGTPAVRANARVAGLALAVGLGALLVATVVTLDDNRQLPFYSPEDGLKIEHGRGLVMAFAAVLLFAATLARAARDGASAGPERHPRRDRSRTDDPERDEDRPPADLTVTPTLPFAREAPPHRGSFG
ncbi:hypothetical protein [Micromonospora endophytica]|uniref:Uncharacterized protein n=1 Tax=Micromonospora endophytica TaxID=515350 RepID=A0A2W2BGX4_9ACTN|nr:hypothetical protein [Micromonospora endophytica]PZF84540.1 hypothetical protein C1I93_29285 [Micromonospora endophytica]RIW45263.1 hypothetical protein D3H59_15935 [Micromonospora endophytica]BCJ59504.1 hypothetical protein Jiend_29260 [Micromonospora endophytica]